MVGMDAKDAVYLLFGQAMPELREGTRSDIVDDLYEGDFDISLASLLHLVDLGKIKNIDPDLIAKAREVYADTGLAKRLAA